jgi:hypothetical protein
VLRDYASCGVIVLQMAKAKDEMGIYNGGKDEERMERKRERKEIKRERVS